MSGRPFRVHRSFDKILHRPTEDLGDLKERENVRRPVTLFPIANVRNRHTGLSRQLLLREPRGLAQALQMLAEEFTLCHAGFLMAQVQRVVIIRR
jgi:hypothetical protein